MRKYNCHEQRIADLLLGKKIISLLINDDQSLLALHHPDGSYAAFQTEGDCCSETWFADIIGVDFLIGGVVVDIEKLNLPSVDDGRTRQEEDSFYGLKITTNKGCCDIVYRNSSNGYYGGCIDHFNGDLPDGMVNITKDWTC